MSVLPFLAIAFGGAAASLLLRRWIAISAVVGLLALVLATIAAATIHPDGGLAIAGGGLTGSAFGRTFLLLVSGAATVLVAIALLTEWTRNLPGALLAGLGAIGLALSIPDPTMAATATIVGGLAGVIVTTHGSPTPRGVAVAAREVRAIAVGGALILLAMAWISRPLGALAQDTAVFGIAYLAVAIGLAMRFGAIPFHLWAARVAEAAPEVALPLLVAWGPAALAIVGLAWVDGSIAPVAPVTGQLPTEHVVIVVIGIACLVLGAIAAWVQDDLEHVVGYATVQDAGIVILAFAVLDPQVWAPSRTWILVLLATRTAFAAWAVALRARFGSHRIADLRGWAHRSPLLVVALLAIAVASIGWPGLLAFDARATVITLAIDGPLQGLVLVAVFLPLLYYGRLLATGFARPSPEIASVADDRPRGLRPLPATGAEVAAPGADVATPGAAAGAAPGAAAGARRQMTGGSALVDLAALNRGPLVAALVLVLAANALTVAGGGLGFVGITEAAVEAAPVLASGNETPVTGPDASSSPGPDTSGAPSPSAGAGPTASPTASPTATPGSPSPSGAASSPSGSASPLPSPSSAPSAPASSGAAPSLVSPSPASSSSAAP